MFASRSTRRSIGPIGAACTGPLRCVIITARAEKRDAGVMCPSFRATGDEKDLTRGRANSLRLALSGQLGPNALTSDDMYDSMALCVGCKGCKRECPTGVDMARMKTEFLYHYRQRHGLSLFDKLVAFLPRYAAIASAFGWLLNLRNKIPGLPAIGQLITGFAANQPLPAPGQIGRSAMMRSVP